MSWEKDFPIGKEMERRVREHFGQFFNVEESNGAVNYDMTVSGKLEVKFDQKATTTGNFAIEVRYKGKPSGITATEAVSWVLCTEEGCWIVRTENLLKLARGTYEQDPRRFVDGGDGNNSKIILVLYEDVKRYTKLDI